MSYYEQLRDDEDIIVRHIAGPVCYHTACFMDKNNDALTFDLAELMDSSKDPYVRSTARCREAPARQDHSCLPWLQVQDCLESHGQLHCTRSSFIRCIKPNQKMQPNIFNGGEILSQLQCAGMVSVLDLMQGGFPSCAFKDLYDMYASVLPPQLAQLDPRTFAKVLFKALGMYEEGFQFSASKALFRPGKVGNVVLF